MSLFKEIQDVTCCTTVNTSKKEENEPKSWFVMRDLKRVNAKLPAYKLLRNSEFEVFTPMKWRLVKKNGQKIKEEIPAIPDLLFVHSTREKLDWMVENIRTLQYRFFKGGGYCEPMTVRDQDMNRFIVAINSTETPAFYTPEEITPAMYGRTVRIIGGPLHEYEVPLLKMRGSKVKRIIVELPTLLAAVVEVNPEYIQLL
jgi:hypothetical protein